LGKKGVCICVGFGHKCGLELDPMCEQSMFHSILFEHELLVCLPRPPSSPLFLVPLNPQKDTTKFILKINKNNKIKINKNKIKNIYAKFIRYIGTHVILH